MSCQRMTRSPSSPKERDNPSVAREDPKEIEGRRPVRVHIEHEIPVSHSQPALLLLLAVLGGHYLHPRPLPDGGAVDSRTVQGERDSDGGPLTLLARYPESAADPLSMFRPRLQPCLHVGHGVAFIEVSAVHLQRGQHVLMPEQLGDGQVVVRVVIQPGDGHNVAKQMGV